MRNRVAYLFQGLYILQFIQKQEIYDEREEKLSTKGLINQPTSNLKTSKSIPLAVFLIDKNAPYS
jgi:hypothetical protein